MVKLLSQSKLQSLHIDTIERAIVFSSLALKSAIVGIDGTNFTDKRIQLFTLNKGKSEITLKILAMLPFDSYIYNSLGGNPIFAVKPFDVPDINLETLLNFTNSPSNPTAPFVPPYPTFVRNLETYLYYYASMLSASLENNRNEVIKIVLQESSVKGSHAKLDITLPLDAKKWSLGNNLVECVKRVVELYIVNMSEFNLYPNKLSILNQSVNLDNNYILAN